MRMYVQLETDKDRGGLKNNGGKDYKDIRL